MTVKISGTDGIDVAQLRAPDGDPVAMTVSNAGVVAFPQSPSMDTTGPIFRAVGDTNQNIANSGYTKLTAGTATFNPDSAWQGGNKFLPNKAGYYHVGLFLTLIAQSSQYQFIAAIYKNGTIYDYVRINSPATSQVAGYVGSLVYLNGTTDYIEFFASQNYSSSTTAQSGSPVVSAHFVRT